MSKLLIVESPSKAKTIGKYLGKDYVVKASVGHVRDLPKSSKNAIDIAGGFVPHYEIVKKKEAVVEEIVEAAKHSDEVILATDPDREGEAIAWHITELLKQEFGKHKPRNARLRQGIGGQAKAALKVSRVVYHEITKEAIKEALEHSRGIDENLRRAQEARRVLDRLVGYDLSGLIWKKVRYGLSAGRVQSPALRILVEREREIKAFKPEKFWTITADLQTPRKEKFTAACEEEPRDEAEKNKIVAAAKSGNWSVSDVTETEARRSPRAPFTTSTIQQAASSRLGFSPGRTMRAAQKLYEAGYITYMRTDSTSLSESARKQMLAVIGKRFGSEFAAPRTYATNVKNAQEAHEAIRPTDSNRENAAGAEDQKRVYRLIWQRAVASQMSDAKLLRTKITATVGADTPNFFATGSRLTFPGWLMADPESRGEELELPKVTKGETLTLLALADVEKETEPPSRYTEAGLVKELEKRGIGRPSTYASIIGTIEERGYAEMVGRALRPTDTGEVVSTFLEKNFGMYISDTFTAEMEDELDDIASGKRQYEKTLADFYKPFAKEVKAKAKSAEKITSLGDAPEFRCPICGGSMEWKLSRMGKFLSCKKFPNCNGALTAEGKPLPKGGEPIGVHPKTGEPIYVKNGRFGPYVQLGENGKNEKKPKMASIPKTLDPSSITIEAAATLLSLPRIVGVHPKTGKEVTSSIGRFGPYIVHDGDFRSLKAPDDVYTIALPRALEILSQEKKARGFRKKKTP